MEKDRKKERKKVQCLVLSGKEQELLLFIWKHIEKCRLDSSIRLFTPVTLKFLKKASAIYSNKPGNTKFTSLVTSLRKKGLVVRSSYMLAFNEKLGMSIRNSMEKGKFRKDIMKGLRNKVGEWTQEKLKRGFDEWEEAGLMLDKRAKYYSLTPLGYRFAECMAHMNAKSS